MSLNIRFLVYLCLFLVNKLLVLTSREISRIIAITTKIKAIIVENNRNIPIKINGARMENHILLDRGRRRFRLRNIKIAIANPM